MNEENSDDLKAGDEIKFLPMPDIAPGNSLQEFLALQLRALYEPVPVPCTLPLSFLKALAALPGPLVGPDKVFELKDEMERAADLRIKPVFKLGDALALSDDDLVAAEQGRQFLPGVRYEGRSMFVKVEGECRGMTTTAILGSGSV